MRVLITGARGFIGRNLTEALRDEFELTTPGRDELDLTDERRVFEFLRHGDFDAVIHAATHNAARNSTKDVSRVLDFNLRMFFNLVRHEDLYGRLIYFGSGAEYDRNVMPALVEEEFLGRSIPIDDYGLSKYICASVLGKASRIYELVLFGCFGPYEDWEIRFISNACAKALFDLPVTIKQNVSFDYMHVQDLVRVVKEFLLRDNIPERRFNVCTGCSHDLLSIARLVLKISGKDLPIQIKTSSMGREYSGSNSRLMRFLPGLQFTPVEDGVRLLYDWYVAHPGLLQRRLLLTDK